jgi:hypothetical protein
MTLVAKIAEGTQFSLLRNTVYFLVVEALSETACQTTNRTSAEAAAAREVSLRMGSLLLHNRVSESEQRDPGTWAENV